jgi:hypothetical protein
MRINDLPPVMTIEQTASFLRLDVDVVAEGAVCGDLPLVVVDGALMVHTDQLLAELGIHRDPPLRLVLTEKGLSA